MAKGLRSKLRKSLPKVKVETIPTKHAGHARELACQIAKSTKRPLIISSSGDGGYNEVINGVMESDNPDVVCAVLPAGNANDHARTMHSQPLHELVNKAKTTKIDLIKITAGNETRYAHSYVGLGMTPVIAAELNKTNLNALKEAVLVAKTFWKYRPFKIQHQGKVLKLDSLLFANINQMAKVLTLAPKNKPADGKFEVITFPTGQKLKLLKKLLKASVGNLPAGKRRDSYKFTALKKMPMQLDGEVMQLNAGTKVSVECAHKALKTII